MLLLRGTFKRLMAYKKFESESEVNIDFAC